MVAGRHASGLTWWAPGDMEHVRSPGGVAAGMSAATEEGCPNSWVELVREKVETGGHGWDQIRMVGRLAFIHAVPARTALSAAGEGREREGRERQDILNRRACMMKILSDVNDKLPGTRACCK